MARDVLANVLLLSNSFPISAIPHLDLIHFRVYMYTAHTRTHSRPTCGTRCQNAHYIVV